MLHLTNSINRISNSYPHTNMRPNLLPSDARLASSTLPSHKPSHNMAPDPAPPSPHPRVRASTLLRPTKSSTLRATPTRSTLRGKAPSAALRPLAERGLDATLSEGKRQGKRALAMDTFPPTPPATPTTVAPATEQGSAALVAAHARIAALEAEVARLREELARGERIASEVTETDAEAEEAEECGRRPGARAFAAKAQSLQADIDGAWDALATPSTPASAPPQSIEARDARAGIALRAALADAHFKNRGLAVCLEDAVERAQRAEAAATRLRARVARLAEENAGLVGAWARSVRLE